MTFDSRPPDALQGGAAGFGLALSHALGSYRALCTQLLKTRVGTPLLHAEVLVSLARDPQAIAEDLARLHGVDASTIMHTLSALERDGLLGRMRHEGDRRRLRIVLTDQGRQRAEQALTALEVAFDQAMQGLPASETSRLEQALRRVAGNCREPLKPPAE